MKKDQETNLDLMFFYTLDIFYSAKVSEDSSSVPSVGIFSLVVAEKSTVGATSAHSLASNCWAFSKPKSDATIFAGNLRI